jgi:PAS domain S-box-containing protein
MEQRKNPVILTIDDEENIRDSFRMFLEDFDYHVIEACNGREGLIAFEREKPDLVLCDLRMPEVDGLEVLEEIKQRSPNTPIIVVSGTGVIGDAIEAIRRGAWNYLLKPIQDMSVLLHAISQAMERARLIVENHRYQEHLEEEVTKRTEALQKAISDLNQSHLKVKESEEKYRSIFENLQDVYFEMQPEGTVTEVSPSISHFSLYRRTDIINNHFGKIFTNGKNRDRLLSRLKTEGSVTDYEIYLQDKDGTQIPCSLNASYQDQQKAGHATICGTLRDITERKQAEARIEYLAYFDALTELPNRRLLLDRLEQNISRARRYGH